MVIPKIIPVEEPYFPRGLMTAPKYFPSLRRCPECKRSDLLTDGKGKFLCRECGYGDLQDIKKLRRLAGKTTGRRGLTQWESEINSEARRALNRKTKAS